MTSTGWMTLANKVAVVEEGFMYVCSCDVGCVCVPKAQNG